MKKLVFTIIFIVLVASANSYSAPLKRQSVSADAKWIMHVDFDAFRSSTIGSLVLGEIKAKHQLQMEALKKLFGSNPADDLFSLTVYGPDADERNAVALISGNFDKSKLLSVLQLNPAYDSDEYEGTSIYFWQDEKSKKDQVGAFASDDLIVISQSRSAVQSALDVIRGDAPSLTDSGDLPLDLPAVSDVQPIFLAASNHLAELTKNKEHAAILQNSRLMAILAAEEEGDTIFRIHLTAQTPEAAMQIEQVVRGMMSFGMLNAANQPALSEILTAVTLTRSESILDLQFSYPSADLFEVLKSLKEQHDQSPSEEQDEKPAQ